MKSIFKTMAAAFLAVSLVACAQVGGGGTVPTLKSQIGKNNVVPSAAELTLQITNFCNAQAQVDYHALVLYCSGKTPALPVSVTTTYVTEASQFSCQVYGWVNANNQLAVPVDPSGAAIIPALGNCPTGTAPVAIAAPSGAPAGK